MHSADRFCESSYGWDARETERCYRMKASDRLGREREQGRWTRPALGMHREVEMIARGCAGGIDRVVWQHISLYEL